MKTLRERAQDRVIAGALWLSGADLRGEDRTYPARFRTVDGLQVGNPVTLRGVRVGKVTGATAIPFSTPTPPEE